MKKKTVLLIVVVLLIIIAIIVFESLKPKAGSNDVGQPIELKQGTYPKAPELQGIAGYINAEEKFKLEDQKGKVVLIDFWTYTCINCIRTIPYLVEWDRKYRDKGLVIVGVHTPEFKFEEKYENVLEAVNRYDIKYPVVQDNNYATWTAYRNRYWPRKYLIDSEGFIRYDHIGEGAYEETERVIQLLLSEINQEDLTKTGIADIEDKTPRLKQTPELYAGYNFALPRSQNVGNKEGLQPNKIIDYILPEKIEKDIIYLDGRWLSNDDNLQAQDDEKSSIMLDFTASSVNIVAENLNEPLELEVFVGDKHIPEDQAGVDVKIMNGKSFVLIDSARLYNLFNGEYGNYKLTLLTNSKDFTFNAFTFG